MHLTRDLSPMHWRWITDHFHSLYERFYCVVNSTTCSPEGLGIPWPVAFLLATSGKKFILQGKSLPSVKEFREDVDSTIAKIKWKHFFLANPSAPKHAAFRSIRGNTPQCRKQVPIELEAFTEHLRHNLLSCVHSARSSVASGGRQFSNILGVFKYALKWLASSCWVTLMSDKDGCFVLVHKGEMNDMINEKLKPDTYVPVRFHAIPFRGMRIEANKWAKKLAEADNDPTVEYGIRRTLSEPNENFISWCSLQCKDSQASWRSLSKSTTQWKIKPFEWYYAVLEVSLVAKHLSCDPFVL